MADEKETEKEADLPEETPATPRARPSLAMIVVLANSIAILGALGVLTYTKLLYKRPVIDEHTELKKRQNELKSLPEIAERIIVPFDKLRVNVAMTSGKAHYASITMAVECRDNATAELVKKKRDLLLDKLIAAMGHRQMTELNTIQGKLVLKSELIRDFNGLTSPAGVTDIYFSDFVLQ